MQPTLVDEPGDTLDTTTTGKTTNGGFGDTPRLPLISNSYYDGGA